MSIPYQVSGKIDIINLFLHDKSDCDCLSEDFVAHELGLILNKATGYRYLINVIPPELTGLDRFTVEVGDHLYSQRCNSELELQGMLPDFIFNAIKAVKELSNES